MEEDSLTRIFVGLGNPGSKYERTRHNIGFVVVQALAEELGWPMKEEKRFKSLVVRGEVEGVKLHLILPQTYMNESGTALRRYMDFFRLDANGIVVVTDDVAIGFGEMRLRARGSSGGHNGLRSIQRHLGTQDYPRLRMGIGSPPWSGEDAMADYVLSNFIAAEREVLPHFVDRGVRVLKRLLQEDLDRVMNDANVKQKKKSPEEGQEKKE